MSRRKLFDLIDKSNSELPENKRFLNDVMTAIERYAEMTSRKPSVWYKPSSLNCMRNMYFTRISAPTDPSRGEYNSIGMADTGTRRHEAIQEVLIAMKDMGYDWEYVDVEQYVKDKQAQGKCTSLKVKGTVGAETHLFDEVLKISFRCDGIIRNTVTNEYYLFEFKNQTSFKYRDKKAVDDAHKNQVVCYCTALDLDKAFVLYENRDVCTLECPEIFEVTKEMKQDIVDRLMTCEQYVEHLEVPPKPDNTKPCRWCNYKGICGRSD